MNDGVWYSVHESPAGDLLLTSDGAALTGLYLAGSRGRPRPGPDWIRADEALAAAREQLTAYFAGRRTTFDLPLAPRGTPFQRRVWRALQEIPYGSTVSYAEIARRAGAPRAARAVGAATGRNPISIVIPCHRVIGSDGSLTGYGGGMERKRSLLALEAGVVGARAVA